MALADLLQALEAEVDGQVTRILADAKYHATQLTVEGAEQLTQRTADAVRRREAQLRVTTARDLARAQHEAISQVLRARAAVLEQVFDRARAALAARQPVVLDRDLEAALDYLDGAAATLHCAPALVNELRGRMAKRPQIGVQADATLSSGFRLHSADGTVEVDATLEGRLAQRTPALAIAVWQELERAR